MKSLDLKCECGCAYLHFEYEIFENGEYLGIDHYINSFYVHQNGFMENLKLIWSILTGKKYSLYGIVIYRDDIEKLKEFVKDL